MESSESTIELRVKRIMLNFEPETESKEEENRRRYVGLIHHML